jgi:hypothetical protein
MSNHNTPVRVHQQYPLIQQSNTSTSSEPVEFLKRVDPLGWHNIISIHPESGKIEGRTFEPNSWTEIETWIRTRRSQNNIYYSINEPRPGAPNSKLSKADIGTLRAVQVDLDPQAGADLIDERQRIRSLIATEMECELENFPSAIIDSGGGFQVLFSLEEKLPAGEFAEQIEAQNRGFAKHFGGDVSTIDIARVFRLPGTLNLPTRNKRERGRQPAPAKIVAITENAMTLKELSAWIAPTTFSKRDPIADTATPLVDLDTQTAITRATDYLTSKAPDNGTYSIAAKIKDFGVSQETCLDLMLEHWRDARGLDKDDDHIRFRVENAYRYGQNAPGISSAEAEFDAVEVKDRRAAPKRKGLIAVDFADATVGAESPYLIDSILDLGAMAVTYGDSNVGKTFVVMDQCFHIAAGRDWNGRRVRQGLVVYVAAEGGKGFMKRIEAYRRHYHVQSLPFVIVPCPIDLQSERADTRRIVELIQDAERRHQTSCVLVVIDTLARAMANGDENTAVDMGKFVAHCDQIREATGATVNVVHHTGKDKAKGARGSSALRAATDTEVEIDAGVMRVAKQRDMEMSTPLRFELVPIEVSIRTDGRPITSCVVRWTSPAETDFAAPIDGKLEEALTAFENAVRARGEISPLLSFSEWTKAYASLRFARGKKSGEKQALVRCSKGLIEAGYIAKTKDNQYVRTATA